MMQAIVSAAHFALCFALLWSVFRRFVLTTRKTRVAIRFAFWLLACVAALGIVGPLSFGWAPSPFGVLMLAAVLVVQWSTAFYWRGGVPPAFEEPAS